MVSRTLDSLVPGPDDDLRGWGAALGGVQVVGLGDATHGTAEFFTLKHRLIAHLVARHGTRVVAFEASEAAAVRVDRWIAGGADDGPAALRGLGFWTWATTEVLALLVDLRRTNATRPAADRVRFVGVDPQHPHRAVDAVVALLRARGGPGRDRHVAALDALTGPSRVDAGAVHDALTAAGDGPLTPDLEIALAHVARAAVLRTAPREDPAARFATRDRLMARAVLAHVDAGAGPVALWAHNGHVRRLGAPVASAGEHLRLALGPAYHPIGLVSADGAFRARRSRGPLLAPAATPTVHALGAAPPATVEGRLTAIDPRDRLIDLRGDAPAWARESTWTRSHGAVAPMVPTLAATPIVPADEFDALALVVRSSPSTPLAPPAGRGWPGWLRWLRWLRWLSRGWARRPRRRAGSSRPRAGRRR